MQWRTTILVLAIVGAGMVTLGAQLVDTWSTIARTLSALGAVALAIIPVISGTKLGKNKVPEWTRARSASEALKSEVYLYQTGSDPYGGDDRDGVLAESTRDILGRIQDLQALAAGHEQPDDKPVPPRMDPDGYVEQRIDDQINNYYLVTASTLDGRLRWLRLLEFGLALLAAGFAAVATLASETFAARIGAWVAVITTSGAAVTAHIAANRYQHLVNTYRATAGHLRSLRDEWVDGRKPDQSFSAFVHGCEDAISVENQGWMAKWAESP